MLQNEKTIKYNSFNYIYDSSAILQLFYAPKYWNNGPICFELASLKKKLNAFI